jgi:hypothetical protein
MTITRSLGGVGDNSVSCVTTKNLPGISVTVPVNNRRTPTNSVQQSTSALGGLDSGMLWRAFEAFQYYCKMKLVALRDLDPRRTNQESSFAIQLLLER